MVYRPPWQKIARTPMNPVHLLLNNNRLHKQIVWPPCDFTERVVTENIVF